MIDEEGLNQAIFDFAFERYGDRMEEMLRMYVDEFPERDWDLPGELWRNNFLAWLFQEKVLPASGRTIAEEFAESSPDLDPEMRAGVLRMRDIVRSEFVVISGRGRFARIKDRETGEIYNVRMRNPGDIPPNCLLTGRIHPFGDHHRFAGVLQARVPSIILDPDILVHAFERDSIERIEDITLRPGTTMRSVLNKYPAMWIDRMCELHGLTGRTKRDKVRMIEERVVKDLPRIVAGLPERSRDALDVCMRNGGVVKYGRLREFDDDMDYFWREDRPVSTIGALRQRGLL
ncbi:MAG: hypothetical protein L0Z54_07015, partial [Thermoplasmata archaeon]|nr:hypothetical protein [Thermoplasmata archaeon]